jgi:hypothetical protein
MKSNCSYQECKRKAAWHSEEFQMGWCVSHFELLKEEAMEEFKRIHAFLASEPDIANDPCVKSQYEKLKINTLKMLTNI